MTTTLTEKRVELAGRSATAPQGETHTEDKMNLAEVFGLAIQTDPSLVNESPSMNCRTEHRNCDGDVYYLFADGSIYSVKDEDTFFCLDSMKDCLLETYGGDAG